MKSHQGMSKRTKETASGKLRRKRAFQSHFLAKKNARKKQVFRQDHPFAKADQKKIKRMI